MTSDPRPDALAAARKIFAYLAETDPLPHLAADAVIGFGTFDLQLAVFCGDLYRDGHARRIIFTGGIGAGTADLGKPEADAWRDELLRKHPSIPPRDIILENRSTNTGENLAFTATLLERDHPELAFGRGLRTALIVASPSRLRRVMLTLRRVQSAIRVIRCSPPADFDRERAGYESKGIAYLPHLVGELDRIETYPARGWTIAESLPATITEARTILHAALSRQRS